MSYSIIPRAMIISIFALSPNFAMATDINAPEPQKAFSIIVNQTFITGEPFTETLSVYGEFAFDINSFFGLALGATLAPRNYTGWLGDNVSSLVTYTSIQPYLHFINSPWFRIDLGISTGVIAVLSNQGNNAKVGLGFHGTAEIGTWKPISALVNFTIVINSENGPSLFHSGLGIKYRF